MFDNCSQTTFLSEYTAKKRKLRGMLVKYTLICTDGRQVGRLYNIVLIDSSGKHIHIQAVGISNLSGYLLLSELWGLRNCSLTMRFRMMI